jgi:hypothetical protein
VFQVECRQCNQQPAKQCAHESGLPGGYNHRCTSCQRAEALDGNVRSVNPFSASPAFSPKPDKTDHRDEVLGVDRMAAMIAI